MTAIPTILIPSESPVAVPAPVDPLSQRESDLLLDELNRVLNTAESLPAGLLPLNYWKRRFRVVQMELVSAQKELSQTRERLAKLETTFLELVERLGDTSHAVPEARQVLELVRDAVPAAVQELQQLRIQLQQSEAETARWREAYAELLAQLQALQASRAWQTANWCSQLRCGLRAMFLPLRLTRGGRT